ncbi:hypothetical protein [Methanobrevibacter sp.]|uniref:hypothetical protein n=1 Tax=Methanobrevibacter sp. TaxID=66852 RepID=UPI00388EAA6F
MSLKLIYHKISEIQKNLMGKNIEDYNLNTLIPLIFKECNKQNLMFFFNFVENACVLNLRDISEENMELNIRYHHGLEDIPEDIMDLLKVRLLCNTFLLINDSVDIGIPVPAENTPVEEKESAIISNDKPVPTHIRKAIDTIQAKGIPVTVEAIKNHLPLSKMSTSARMECNKYLKNMEAE